MLTRRNKLNKLSTVFWELKHLVYSVVELERLVEYRVVIINSLFKF